MALTHSTSFPRMFQRAGSAQFRRPLLHLVSTQESRHRYLTQCVPLHKAALEGDWKEAKKILDQDPALLNSAITKGWATVLHIAVGANHESFVEELLKLMSREDLELQDIKGNTAFCFAAAVGNVHIAERMRRKNASLPMIRGGEGVTPLHLAVLQGRSEMAWYLFDKTRETLYDDDWFQVFLICVNSRLYELALEMLNQKESLAFARGDNDETALHVLARKPLDCGCRSPLRYPKHDPPVLKLTRRVWDIFLTLDDSKMMTAIREPSQVTFIAAEVGNFEFLSVIMSTYPDLIWELNTMGQSIIHVAALHRHASIFNLIHEIGPSKDLLLTFWDDEGSTLLHSVAEIAPTDRLNVVSGAALQMMLELTWFEEVKKNMQPSYIERPNHEGIVPRELFTEKHKELLKKGESWMKRTASSCMVVSTLIATGVFSAAFSVPGGTKDDSGSPNYLKKHLFTVFAISDALALTLSTASTLIFLSILISRYAEEDFLRSLPFKLIFGLVSLFLSIVSMMGAFSSAFFITYYHAKTWVVPITIAFRLWHDIVYSHYMCGSTVVNLMNNIITEGHSISRPPYFDGRNYIEWKERMKIFIQSVDFKLWLLIKNGPKVPTKLVDNEEVEKSEDEYDEEDMKNLELEAKAKNILHCALNPDDFEIFSEGPKTSKQMWDELDRVFHRERTGDNSSTPQGQLSSDPTAPDTSQFSSPDLYFLQETRESMNKFLELCVPLHKLALEGNWQAAKVILGKDSRLKHAAIADGWATLLHVAVGANHASFVKELLQEFDNDQYISLQDYRGNTAFCFAVASGNMEIVELLKGRDPHLPTRRGGSDYIPIQFAAMQGNCDMTRYLYDISKEAFEDTDKIMLFFTFIKTGNYHMALKMADEWVELAYARDDNNETALHLLAVNQNPLDSCCHCPEMEGSFRINPDTKHVMFQLVNFLWKKILQHKDHSEAMRIISEPSQLLYDAAEVGNFGFLSELISAYPGKIIWEVDNNGQSIIHTAVSYRHASIFNLVHEIGFIKDILISYIVKENNTLLHLAAKLAPPDRLAIVSGAAFQMCLEIIWFEERMKIFIQSVDFKLWLLIKNGPKVPTKLVDNEEVEKSEDEYDEEDMKNLELEAKAKNILHCALNPDVFEIFSEGPKTSKQMWDELDRVFNRERTGDYTPTPQGQFSSDPTAPDTSQFNSPDLYFLQDTSESLDKFMELCVPLHKLALEGNWPAAKVILQKDGRLKHAAITTGWTTLLHVAAGANHAPFMEELLEELNDDQYISLQDYQGNTAFCFAVASGNMKIVNLLRERDPYLPTKRGGNDYIPIQIAAMQAKCDMTRYLYHISKEAFNDKDKIMLFFTLIKTRSYGMAFDMALQWQELAYARDHNKATALHLLAKYQNPLDSCCHCPDMDGYLPINPDTKHVMFQLVNFLWKTILHHKGHSQAMGIISEPSQLLYDAAEVGIFGFLSELISTYPNNIIWEVDDKGQSIIHTAVSYRHASIFNLVHEIGFIKDIIISYIVKEHNPSCFRKKTKNNTLLHLAAKLAPPDRLEIVSGAAFQMCLEIIWFEVCNFHYGRISSTQQSIVGIYLSQVNSIVLRLSLAYPLLELPTTPTTVSSSCSSGSNFRYRLGSKSCRTIIGQMGKEIKGSTSTASNLTSNIITEHNSILWPPRFDGKNFTEWKERMRTFIQSVNFKLWLVIKNGPNIPTKLIYKKSEDEYDEYEYNEEDMKNLELEAKARHILYCTLYADAPKIFSEGHKTAKQIWDELDREMTRANSPTPSPELISHYPSFPFNYPDLYFLDETRESMDKFLKFCVPLHKYALTGNWPEAKCILNQDEDHRLKHAAITKEWSTLLHIAAGANQFDFVEKLLQEINDEHIVLQDSKGQTAFCLAVASGNMPIVDLLRRRTQLLLMIRDKNGNTPLQFALMQGKSNVAWYLYEMLNNYRVDFDDQDKNSLFFTAIKAGNYRMALMMAERWKELAFARDDQNNETALHVLALNHKINHGKKHVFFQLVNFLWNRIQSVNFRWKDQINIETDFQHLAHETNNGKFLRSLIIRKIQTCSMNLFIYLFMELINSCSFTRLSLQITNFYIAGQKQHEFFELVNFLWKSILGQQNFSGAIRIISEPSKLLFNAAKVGNFGFLSELISSHPSLIWEVDDKRQSIIHTAVSHRHSSIFNLIHEIGSAKDVILSYIVQENNTILHLAAKLAPPGRLGLVSGAPVQMCLELIWFEEVKKIMPPSFIMFKNSDGLTAQELFTMEHEGLRKGEEWMKRTAEFCMLISTVIATAVFSAAVNIPGGIDEQTKKPNYLDKTSFLVFAISDAAAFVSSAIAILIFLSIIVSPYAEYDFYKSLPLKLICGLVTLFISIACMMVAFDSAFFITYNYGSKVVPNLIAVLACVPMLLFIALQFPLWSDIIYAAFYCRTISCKPLGFNREMIAQNIDSATPEPQDAVVIDIEDSTTTNTELQLTSLQNGVPINAKPQLKRVDTATYKRPSLDFLQDTKDAMEVFFSQCVPLYKHALDGNWQAAKHILDANPALKTAAIAPGWPTVLHVAAGTNHYHFVEELLNILDNDAIQLQDKKGNTAFCFVAAAGNWRIAELMLKRNILLPTVKGGDGMTPLHFAALQGRCPMACKLYPMTKEMFDDEDWELLFFTCIKTCNYHLALKMVRDRKELAFARDGNNGEEKKGGIALHLLAQNQKPLDSCCHCHQHQIPVKINPGMKQHVFLQLVNFLWNTLLENIDSKSKILDIISEPSHLLFDAAEVGNFGFLSELISAYPSLIWEVDSRNRRNNTLLHLAAKLAPSDRLELVSGAAFQMSHELIWFEEVKKIMPPSFIMLKNSEDKTAQELFTREHEGLRRKAEDWMKRTAEFCILISTVIATAVFSAAINIPGGIDDQTKKPNYLDKTSFLVFAISDGIAFISSATSILIFLSILISRYAEYDFHKSLPFKLICGLVTLFISITCMMVAFGSAFFITYDSGLKVVPDSISILASVPILLYITLQFSLWKDIIYSTIHCRNLFKPSKRMIHISSR
ncbi:Ankyrin-1 [Glycine max]|nr:Ankyrin-1 [Glycine max]